MIAWLQHLPTIAQAGIGYVLLVALVLVVVLVDEAGTQAEYRQRKQLEHGGLR